MFSIQSWSHLLFTLVVVSDIVSFPSSCRNIFLHAFLSSFSYSTVVSQYRYPWIFRSFSIQLRNQLPRNRIQTELHQLPGNRIQTELHQLPGNQIQTVVSIYYRYGLCYDRFYEHAFYMCFFFFFFSFSFFGYMHDMHGLLMVTTQFTQYLTFDSWSRTDHRP